MQMNGWQVFPHHLVPAYHQWQLVGMRDTHGPVLPRLDGGPGEEPIVPNDVRERQVAVALDRSGLHRDVIDITRTHYPGPEDRRDGKLVDKCR